MFYEKDAFKQLKKQTSRDCVVCVGKCKGHKDITEQEPVSIIIADKGIFLERAKGQDAIVRMEQITAYKQSENTLQFRTTDAAAKKLMLIISSQHNRDKACKILNKYMTREDGLS